MTVSPAELAELFVATRDAAGKPRGGDVHDLAAELARMVERSTGLAKPRELVIAVAELAPDDVFAFLASCRVDELALTRAAAAGDSQAIQQIERRCAGVLAQVTARYAGEHTREDLRQLIAEKLFVGEAPTIGRYDGMGSLPHWVRVIAVRLCIDLHRQRDRRRESPSDDADIELGLVAGADLAAGLLEREHRSAIVTALRAAVGELSASERRLLRQQFVHRLTIDQLSAASGIHRATAARRLARVRATIAASVRAHLATHFALSEQELEQVVGVVASRLELSLPTLLATTSRSPG